MAGAVRPFRIRVRRLFGKTAPLIKKHALRLLENAVIYPMMNSERKRAQIVRRIVHIIIPPLIHRRKIEPPHLVPRLRVGRPAVPNHRRPGKHHLVPAPAADLQLRAGRVRFHRIKTNLGIGKHRDLHHVRLVTKLIHDDPLRGRPGGRRRKRKQNRQPQEKNARWAQNLQRGTERNIHTPLPPAVAKIFYTEFPIHSELSINGFHRSPMPFPLSRDFLFPAGRMPPLSLLK
jgi:hypothetical protein